MEQFLTANDNKVDAIVASNDGTAGGAIAALDAQGLAGSVPVSGQDADKAALNRVARGTQTVSVWKDSRELGKKAAEIAAALAAGKTMPVPDQRWDPYHVSRTYFLNCLTFLLNQAAPAHDKQGLAERMCVPGRASAGGEGDGCPANARGSVGLITARDLDGTCEVLLRS